MMTTSMIPVTANNDAELVSASRTGNRDAFGQIVARYQSLVCSLAYSATGSLGQSEDLAQETFLIAWKQLADLREPEKLRAWLCGIARNLIHNSLRRQGREPSHHAESLDDLSESHSPEPWPTEQAISHEERAILWRSLERIPEIYREPLVLFYREHQSIEVVAQNLELSEDAVKQRLSRGRKMLHEQVLAFVEGALERTNPGKAFTVAVLAALPVVLTTAAKAATFGTVAAKGVAAAKSAGLMGALLPVLNPCLSFICLYGGYRMDVEDARSPQRRELIIRYYRIVSLCLAVFVLAALSLVWCGYSQLMSPPRLAVKLLAVLAVAYIGGMVVLNFWLTRSLRKISRQEIIEGRPLPPVTPAFEYRSQTNLLGLPLIHIRLRGGRERGPVKAWIAAGDSAIGVIFAFGGMAIAPISFGGIVIGLLPLGGLAIGPVALGGFSLAVWSVGGIAIGWQAFGGCAIAWNAAVGGVALAHDFAMGGLGHAAQANNEAAQLAIQTWPFFQTAQTVSRYLPWINLLLLLPLFLWWRTVKNRVPKN
jgi:RNA polymerase sigma factor (sigma-70 family)